MVIDAVLMNGEILLLNGDFLKFLLKMTKSVTSKKYHPRINEVYRERYQIARSIFYLGNKYVCPCCSWNFRKFLTHGVIPRSNALCPRCRALERHRLLWLYFKDQTNIFHDNLRVLHFAPERVFEKKLKRMRNLDYITADLDPRRAMIQMDITNIPYEDNSFGVILCSHVLEHIPDDRKAMRELYRVLKPGGWAILQVPIIRDKTFEDFSITKPEDRERVFGQWDHVRAYGKDYKDRLEKAGFKVRVDDYVKRLGADKIKKYALKENEDIYYCEK